MEDNNKMHFRTKDGKYVGYIYENQHEINTIDLAPTISIVVRCIDSGNISNIGGVKDMEKAKDIIKHMFSNTKIDYQYNL